MALEFCLWHITPRIITNKQGYLKALGMWNIFRVYSVDYVYDIAYRQTSNITRTLVRIKIVDY